MYPSQVIVEFFTHCVDNLGIYLIPSFLASLTMKVFIMMVAKSSSSGYYTSSRNRTDAAYDASPKDDAFGIHKFSHLEMCTCR